MSEKAGHKAETTVLATTTVVSVALLLAIALLAEGFSPTALLLTPDQRGHKLFRQGQYEEAAEQFTDPSWQATAWFRAGEFKKGAGIWAGLGSAEAVFNEGNALVMLGKYEQAVERYDQALKLRSTWEPAVTNRGIAAARAERLKKEGGDMTGGEMGADEISFDTGKKSDGGDQDQEVVAGDSLSDEEMRAVWLRRVETKPADFLRAKFAYQHAQKENVR